MKTIEIMKAHWKRNFDRNAQSGAFAKLAAGELNAREYAAILKQIFHQTRENPQLQALATIRFRGPQRELIKKFYRHAISEVGHDQLALNDARAVGANVDQTPFERPLPATTALLASAFYQIEHHNPIGYLGYLFHLEYTPTQLGAYYMDNLRKVGIPDEGMTFIAEHAAVDIAHVRMIEDYAEKLVRSDDDLHAVLYMMELTADLYAKMLSAAIDSVDRERPAYYANFREA